MYPFERARAATPLAWWRTGLQPGPCFLLLALLLMSPRADGATPPNYQVAPPASWVEVKAPAPAVTVKRDSLQEGVAYLLRDSQHHFGRQEYYGHYARQFLTEEGVQTGSQIRIYFDPSYQALTLHQVRLIRAGNEIDQLPVARIEVLQRETDLSAQLYDGSVTLVVFPVDLRVGDVLDYSFSITGWNPVFGGRAVGSESLEWGEAVAHRALRILVPAGRSVDFRNHGGDHAPDIRQRDGEVEYLWENRNQAAIRADDDLPAWFDPYAYVEWSEFANWAEVVRWGIPLYPAESDGTPQLDAAAESLRPASGSPQATARAALRFVQDEVRYLGFEIGPNSHRPSLPADVLQRRFGDCKDKVYLLCALLNRLGVEAHPALVNTAQRRRVMELLPSPLAFDHVICRIRIEDREFWVDPTRGQQVGELGELVLPLYAQALVIAEGQTELTVIPELPQAERGMKVVEEFTVRAADPLVELTVSTTYEGAEAERQRGQNADMSRDELQKSFLNFYARYYPEIGVRRPIEVRERPGENRLVLLEYYTITNFWQAGEDPRYQSGEFYAWAVDEMLRKPDTLVRTMPLAIAHPVRRQHLIRVKLAEDIGFEPDDDLVPGEAFKFRFTSAKRGRTLELNYEYESRTNFLWPAATAEHVKLIDQASESTAYVVPRSNPDAPLFAGGINWPILMLGVIWSLLVMVGMVVAWRHRPIAAGPPPLPDPRLTGLGGWLLLVGFGVLLRPFFVGFVLWENAAAYEAANWMELTSPGGARFHALWAPVLIGELLANLALLGLAILVLLLFFRRRRTFARYFVATLWLSAGVVALDSLACTWLPVETPDLGENVKDAARTTASAAIWTLYALRSKRVRNTFVN